MQLFPLWETTLLSNKKTKTDINCQQKGFEPKFFWQHPMAALLFPFKCHTAEIPSKGQSEELHQTARNPYV